MPKKSASSSGSTEGLESASKEEKIGFHKGALSTLAKERQEFIKLLSIVEQLMQMHIKALKDLGIDLAAKAKEAQQTKQKTHQKEKKIEDIV